MDDKAADDDIKALIKAAEEDYDPNELRKCVLCVLRVGKLRLFSRLNEIHNHSSPDRLRAGACKVFIPRSYCLHLFHLHNEDELF